MSPSLHFLHGSKMGMRSLLTVPYPSIADCDFNHSLQFAPVSEFNHRERRNR